MREAILAVYRGATDDEKARGRRWYGAAHGLAVDLAARHCVSVACAAGVLAALSPGCSWTRNVSDAGRLLAGETRGFATYGLNVAKALRIAKGESPETVLGGHKVRAFYRLILTAGTDPEAVCVDGHAVNVALGRHGGVLADARLAPRDYARYAEAYREAATVVQETPASLQAITWLAWRAGERNKQGRLAWQ